MVHIWSENSSPSMSLSCPNIHPEMTYLAPLVFKSCSPNSGFPCKSWKSHGLPFLCVCLRGSLTLTMYSHFIAVVISCSYGDLFLITSFFFLPNSDYISLNKFFLMFTFPLSFAFETTEQEQETKMSSDRKASMELSK